MTRLSSVALVGLLAVGAPQERAPDTPAEPSSPTPPRVERSAAAPVPLQPVPAEHTCAYFDEGDMRARLLDPDLVAREAAFDELVRLCHHHPEIRATVQAWSRETSTLELAWTARLALREWNASLRRALSDTTQGMRVQVYQAQPWQDPYLRDALLSMGLDPTQYRVRGRMTVSQEDLARMGLALPTAPADPTPQARQPESGYDPIEPAPVLGVVCDESRTDRVILTRVVSGSIADAIGLVAGDRLVRIGAHELTAPSDIDEAMHAWSERGPDGPDALEIVALGADGRTKVRVWTGAR